MKGASMGDIAEMMLEGTLCEGCGVYMGEGDGYPVRCEDCTTEESGDDDAEGTP